MVNFNGRLMPDDAAPMSANRGFLYGDAVFETMKVADGRLMFAEDHYFRLMASMRILRMEIPMKFTPEFFEQQVLELANESGVANSARVRLTVFREAGGNYQPNSREISFIATASGLDETKYSHNRKPYEIEIYKDFLVEPQLLSTIKHTNRLINITGSIFADENGYQNCLLLNSHKNVAEALNGNIFMLTGNTLITPPLAEGCLNGVMRKQILAIARKSQEIEMEENPISPFDLQKADELFITNVIMGVQPVSRYRKKDYGSDFSSELIEKLNLTVGLS